MEAVDNPAQEYIRQFDLMVKARANWEAHWTEIAPRVLPRQDDFIAKRVPGAKRTELLFDATAALGLERFGAAMESMLTPRTQRWHGVKTTNPELNQIRRVQAFFEEVTRRLFYYRYSPRANYASQQHETYMSLGAFGTGTLFIDGVVDLGLRYKSIHLGEMYFAEDHQGRIDKAFRKFEMTARQAAQRWGVNMLSERIQKALESNPEERFEFLHCVKPNDERIAGRSDWRGMAYSSVYISMIDRKIVHRSGYYEFPYAVSRYVTAPNEIYGRSPAMLVLPDIKMVNEMSKTVLRAAHKQVEPPLLLRDDGILSRVSTKPNALNYGGIDRAGRQSIQPMQVGGNIGIGIEMMDQRRRTINDAFLVTLFQILVDSPQMTATEVLQRAQEKGALLTPTIGRQQSEALGPMIEREIGILSRAGKLPPLPPELAEAEGEFEIEYDSPLTRAQRAEEAVGLFRTIEGMTPLAQINPRIMRRFNGDEILKGLAEINAVPNKFLYTDDELAAMDQQEQQQAQMQQLLQAAPVVADSTKKMVEAQSLREGGLHGGV